MTDPAAFTDAAWAAREARRLALEEAAALAEAERRKQEALLKDPYLEAMEPKARDFHAMMIETAADTAADIAIAIRALLKAGK